MKRTLTTTILRIPSAELLFASKMPKFASRYQAAYVHRLTIWNDRRWCACQAISPANSDASCKGAAPLAETRIRQVRSCALCLIVQPTTGGLRRVATQGGCQDE